MPARASYFRCICIECVASGGYYLDGSPIGREIPSKDRAAHHLQVRKNQSQINNLASDVFTLTLSDGARPNIPHAPSYQTASILPQSSTRLQESGQSEFLASSSTWTNGIPDSSGDIDHQQQDNTLTEAFANLSISVSHQNLDRRQSAIRLNHQHVKHRRNVRLKRSAKIIEDINTRIQNCCEKIAMLRTTPALQPVQETLSFLEKEIGALRHALETTTYVDVLTKEAKRLATERLKTIDAYVTTVRMAFQPTIDDGPVSYNSAHHFKNSVDEHNEIAQGALLLGVICSVIMGVARSGGDFIMVAVRYLLGLAFMQGRGGQPSHADDNVLSQIPITIATALSKFNLDARVRIYAACPACHFTHPPKYLDGSSIATYPERCTNIRKLPKLKDGDSDKAGPGPCDAPLLHAISNHTAERKPLKSFVYHEFHDYLSGLLSQGNLEKQADEACDNLMDMQRSGHTASDCATNPFEGDFLKTFKGPSGDRLFVDRQGEGRFVFSLNVDFFNPEGLRTRGPTISAGIISMACLNLPIDIRYKPENMYLSIIPGPREPHHMELNHYLRPLVDDMVMSWKNGVCLSETASSSCGRVTRSAIVCAVCDLQGARKASQLASPSSHHYCTVCRCKDKATLWRSDINHPDWQLQDHNQLRRLAEEYRNFATWEEQETHFKIYGVRWTELWRLPYWDPSRQLVVDPMHCILEGVVQAHCREILGLTTISSLTKDKVIPAFTWPFKVVDPTTHGNGRNEKDLTRFSKQVKKIHTLLTAPIFPPDVTSSANLSDDSDDEEQVKPEPLVEALMKNNMDALQFVCNDLNCRPEPIRHTNSSGNTLFSQRFNKIHWAQALVKWRQNQPLQNEKPQPIKYGTPEVMARIRQTIKNTVTPSWVDSVPYNFGDAAAGTLKANEWRTLATIYLPIALVLSWGEGTVHTSTDLELRFRKVLDHTMSLFSATRLACMRYTNPSRILAYRHLMVSYISNLDILHPDAPKKTNPHMSLHIYEFLKLFGPVYSWWCFPFERLIGMLQRQTTNHKTGELETTMLESFLKGGKLRRWLSNPNCPPIVKKMKQFFDQSYTRNVDDTLGTWNDDPSLDDLCEDTPPRKTKNLSQIPEELQPLTRNGMSQLRARVHHNGYIYSTSSAHLGNSLVYFYPEGNRQSSPVPASIKYIFTREGSILYAVQRQLNAPQGTLDPFKAYPHFPAKLYSTQLSQSIEAVNPEWVMCHYARCDITGSMAVVLALSQY